MSDKNRVDFPFDPNPEIPSWKLPPGAWDTHIHILGPPHLFPYAESRISTPPAAPVEHYLAIAAVLGFERGVTVQASAHGDEDVRVTLNAIARSDGRLVGIVRANPRYEPADIDRLHAAGVRGMRVTLARHRNGHFDQAKYDRLVSLAQRKSWILALHMDPAAIIRLPDVIRRTPVPTLIENYAMIDAREGLDQPALKTMIDLAKEPHVWLKTASAYRMLRKGANYEQMRAVARVVADASPDRLIWGTDWPHPGNFAPGQVPNDGELVNWLLDFVPDESARRKMLVDNPKRLFDFA